MKECIGMVHLLAYMENVALDRILNFICVMPY